MTNTAAPAPLPLPLDAFGDLNRDAQYKHLGFAYTSELEGGLRACGDEDPISYQRAIDRELAMRREMIAAGCRVPAGWLM